MSKDKVETSGGALNMIQKEQKETDKTPQNKAWIKYLILLVIVLLCISGFYGYVKYTEIYPSTEDAYVNANTIQVSAQVTGKLDQLYVSNNQEVTKNQLLFTIEPQSFEYALEKAKADLTLAEQEIAAIKDSINLEEAKLRQAQAQKFVAEQKEARIAKLAAQGMVSEEDADEAKGNLEVENANVNAALASIAQQEKQLILQQSKISAAKAGVSTNASGNWVKVVQRFPVKILLDQNETHKVPQLRVGASAIVQVDTH